jgi:hypothetical protein
MRKIEKEMLEAIKFGQDWLNNNTEVSIYSSYRVYFADVYLHGNHIAEVICRMGWPDIVKPNVQTLKDYPTRTTMSRLRALGVNVYQSKNVVYLDEEAVSDVA